jgi:hypothetical protein
MNDRPDRPIPKSVLQTWPEVDPATWRWLSPLRLCAPGHSGGSHVLVVVDAEYEHAMGGGAGRDEDINAVYAELRMALMASIGREIACQDGAPVTREDSDDCVWCGLAAADHQSPDEAEGPTYQSGHLRWPGDEPITTTEAEAAFTVELEAMRLRTRGEPTDE